MGLLQIFAGYPSHFSLSSLSKVLACFMIWRFPGVGALFFGFLEVLRLRERPPFTILALSGSRRGALTPFWRSPGAGEGHLHHFGVLREPERGTYTVLAFSGSRRGALTPFWRSPGAGERHLHRFGVLREPERPPFTILAFSRSRRAVRIAEWPFVYGRLLPLRVATLHLLYWVVRHAMCESQVLAGCYSWCTLCDT